MAAVFPQEPHPSKEEINIDSLKGFHSCHPHQQEIWEGAASGERRDYHCIKKNRIPEELYRSINFKKSACNMYKSETFSNYSAARSVLSGGEDKKKHGKKYTQLV